MFQILSWWISFLKILIHRNIFDSISVKSVGNSFQSLIETDSNLVSDCAIWFDSLWLLQERDKFLPNLRFWDSELKRVVLQMSSKFNWVWFIELASLLWREKCIRTHQLGAPWPQSWGREHFFPTPNINSKPLQKVKGQMKSIFCSTTYRWRR